ncbi:MAG: translation elongation factor 4 [Nitrospirota bacterium]|nr:translation elongation factor 4 [Nitrospirota bacterium]
MTNTPTIRNFSIIAHVDHGKSTLADRLLERTGLVNVRTMRPQFLDRLEIERERGITIKAQTVRMPYAHPELGLFLLNMIDTPGHVDFGYEVSRSLAACEGALLLVDASQGVEAQTLANAYLAVDQGLEVVLVINKIDLPSARPEDVRAEVENLLGLDASNAILASAKEGVGIEAILDALVRRIPPPKGTLENPLQALIFDSWFDSYRGVILLVRVFEGTLTPNTAVEIASSGEHFQIEELGVFQPDAIPSSQLGSGEVGYVILGTKEILKARVGDTLIDPKRRAAGLPGFRTIHPNVYAGVFPVRSDDLSKLRHSLEKLSLNDASIQVEPETSRALGFGFRLGFLGMLHMEIVQERLEREYGLDLVITSPTVKYRAFLVDGNILEISNPSDLPPPNKVERIEEPFLDLTVYTPEVYLGQVLKLLEEKRGVQKGITYPSPLRVVLAYEIPLAEIIVDFHDRLKSLSRGYASMDYTFLGYKPSDLLKLDILVNQESVDALSLLVPQSKAYTKGRALVDTLKSTIPRQLFEVVIQASIGSRVIARNSVSALRKNVTAKCYGGDITRKRKLLEKQKEGKKRLKMVGNVEIPQEAFLAVLKMEK